MSKWARSARVRRVSSHAITAASLRVRSARRVMSSRLPIGVATTKRVPRGLRLGGLFLGFGHEERPLAIQDDLPRDDALLEPLDGRELVHDLEHDFLEDRAEAACARAALEGFLRDRRDRILGELEAHLLEIEVLLVLLDDRVLRLPEDPDQRRLVEVVERRDDREPPDELGNEAVLQQVLRLDHRQEIAHAALLAALDVGADAHARPPDPRLDDLLEPDERAAAEDEHVRRVYLDQLLWGALAAALPRDARDRALEDLDQRLLDALTRDIAHDRGVRLLPRDRVGLAY